jgi:pimeloyl-ACP methyl ester carboxylesterase
MSSAHVGDHDLYYERSGSGEPLFLIMGMSGTHLTWGEPFLDALRRDFEVVIYDHRGIGRSSRAEPPYTIADLADDASGLLDALGWENPHVVGISMGGMVAQELALRHPERVRTLTLGCTYAGGPGASLSPEATLQRLQASWMGGDREVALRTAWEVNVAPGFAADEAQYTEFRRRAIEVPAALPAIMAQAQACAMHDASARLGQIAAPTLVIHGTADEMLPVSNAKVIAGAVPGARLEILDGVGHLFFWEDPERSASLVREHALAAARA